MSREKEGLKTSISIMSVNSCLEFLEYVLRYLYLTHSLISVFDPERREIHDGTEKRDMQWERTFEGVVRALLGFPYLNQLFVPIGPAEGGRYEQKSEIRVCMPPRYLHPSQIFFFFLDYWSRSVKQRVEKRGKESPKGDTHFA
jgi:hypothetical protein